MAVRHQHAVHQPDPVALMEIGRIRKRNDSLPSIVHGDADLILIVRLRCVSHMSAIHGTGIVRAMRIRILANDFPCDGSGDNAACDGIQTRALSDSIDEIDDTASDAA